MKPKPKAKKVVSKRHRAAVVTRQKPVKVEFNPFANLVASGDFTVSAADVSRRDRYLRYAGLAFALLAVASLSLRVLCVRFDLARAR